MAHQKLKSKLVVARWAIEALPLRIKAEGTFEAAAFPAPAHWTFATSGCKLSLAVGLLRLPDDPALSTLLDVWLDVGGKVLSVSWFPDHPWAPPAITALKAGDWMYRLGWRDLPP